MECERFLVEYGLYDKQKSGYEDFDDLISLLSGNVKIDVYCSKCKSKRIFSAVANKIKLPKENRLVGWAFIIINYSKEKNTYIIEKGLY